MSFLRRRPALTTATLSLGALGSYFYLWKRDLERRCPQVSIQQLPPSSACRNFVETAGELLSPTRHSIDAPRLVTAWAGGNQDRWVPYLVAVQKKIPASLLSSYRGSETDTYHMMENLVAAFVEARSKRPEARFLDDVNTKAFSLEPGNTLFGKPGGMASTVLGTWSSNSRFSDIADPSSLPFGRPLPVTEFPSNKTVLQKSMSDSAGTVIYWAFPLGMAKMVDKVASFGYPWRFMLGGFHEFIVEKVSDDIVKVTYVAVECYHLHPSEQAERDFKTTPQWTQMAHKLYAQSLLEGAVRHLEDAQRMHSPL